jgi:hypothetical protein
MTHNKLLLIILNCLAPVLREAGYCKAGRCTFMAQDEETKRFVHVQPSRTTTTDYLVFTINLGVLSMTLAKRMRCDTAKHGILDCHWQERLGFLMPDPQDRWWTASTDAEALEVGKLVADLVKTFAIPELNRLTSTQALATLWRSGRSPGLTKHQRHEYLQLLETT